MITREKLIEEIEMTLGGGMVDVDLDPKHYNFAIESAIDRYRLRSQNALEESFVVLDIQKGKDTYFLPKSVQIVRSCYRNGTGLTLDVSNPDPAQMLYYQNMYAVQNPTGTGAGAGSLALFDLAAGQRELMARLFVKEVIFTWEPSRSMIRFHRTFAIEEQMLLRIYNIKPEEVLFDDIYARCWIRDYAVAKCKVMLGAARSKFQSISGPDGTISLDGEALKTEATAEFERLEKELVDLLDQREGYGMVIG